MKLEKWKTSVIGIGPWMVQDHDDPLGVIIGQFRSEAHAEIFIKALFSQQLDSADPCKHEHLFDVNTGVVCRGCQKYFVGR